MPTAGATPHAPATATAQPGAITISNAGEVVELSRWGRGWVRELIYAPDGHELALVTSLGLYIHDAGTLALLRSVKGEGWDYAVAFSPDWTAMAWASGSELLLLDASDGTVIRSFAGEPGRLGTPMFSPDGRLLATIRFPPGEEVYTGAVELWRVADGALLNRWACDGSHVAFAADGESLATWYTMTGIRLWRVPGGELLRHIEGWVDDVAFSPDGQFMAQASMQVVRLWQIDGWSHAFDLESGLSNLRAIAFSPDGARLAAVSGDGKGKVWQVADGQELTGFGPETGTSIGALGFAPDGQTLASAAMDVQFWQLPEGRLTATLEGYFPPVSDVTSSADGAMVAAVTAAPWGGEGNVWLLETATGSRRRLPVEGAAISLALAPDGSHLALGMWDSSVQLLELPDGELVQTMTGHPAQVQSVAFSPDGRLLASSSMEEARLWHTNDGSPIHVLEVPRGGWIESAVFSPDGDLLAALASDGRVFLWQVLGGERLKTLQARDDGWSGQLAFSPDGASVALAKHDLVLVWRIDDSTLVESYEVPEGTSQVAFSRDGSLLAHDAGGRLQLRRRADGSLLHTLSGHGDVITGLTFSGDGRVLVSGAWDGTVRQWGLGEP
ncbi:MAG: WD40 repeat domain-containing protein [Anaerolineae bacterium]|nr:WD40 repeat domain-containing protein [Anaerolineae bacterium]